MLTVLPQCVCMCTQGAEPGKESDTQDSTSNNAKTQGKINVMAKYVHASEFATLHHLMLQGTHGHEA